MKRFASKSRKSSPPALATIRPACQGDAWEFDAIDRAAYPLDYRPHPWWLEALGAYKRTVWAAELRGVVCGFALADDLGPRFAIRALAVVSHRRKAGIGRQLVHAVIQAAHQRPAEGKVTVEVRESNLGGQLFLKALGFRWMRTLTEHRDEPGYFFVLEPR